MCTHFYGTLSAQSQIGLRTGDLAEDSAKPLLGDTNLRSDLGKHLSFYIIMNIYKIITSQSQKRLKTADLADDGATQLLCHSRALG